MGSQDMINSSRILCRRLLEEIYPEEKEIFDDAWSVLRLTFDRWGQGKPPYKGGDLSSMAGLGFDKAVDWGLPIAMMTAVATMLEMWQLGKIERENVTKLVRQYAKSFGAPQQLVELLIQKVPSFCTELLLEMDENKNDIEWERRKQDLEKTLPDKDLAEHKLERINKDIKTLESVERDDDYSQIIGKSGAIRKLIEDIEKAKNTDATVLITGETGVGKELVARAIHESNDRRKNKPYQAVNIASISESLLESELFGHVKGAFTGAINDKKGFFENANGGTIFLDEIGELNNLCQVKILRVLQEKEIMRVGGNKTIPVDVRVIAATNRDLQDSLREGTFRKDLFYRLDVLRVKVPSLRERKEDIPMLAYHFIDMHSDPMVRKRPSITKRAMEKLRQHEWPGNVRELENCIIRAIINAKGNDIGQDEIAFSDVVKAVKETENFSRYEKEKEAIITALKSSNSIKEALHKLEMPKSTFYQKCKDYKIIRPKDYLRRLPRK